MQAISKMQMLDKGTAKINWRMIGGLGPMSVEIQGASIIEMNLLTGRIFNHRYSATLTRARKHLVLLALFQPSFVPAA